MTGCSLFADAPDIEPRRWRAGMTVVELVQAMGKTCFEARNLRRAAELAARMVDENDVIWLGIAGAGIAGGMGGLVASLIEAGHIDVICSTGAQVYHDLHFAFGLPVKAVDPPWDDTALRQHGDTRIYDIGIREHETLEAQDELIRRFVREQGGDLCGGELTSWAFNLALGRWAARTAPHAERSFVVAAARAGVPVFWDSHTNHSIAMNLLRCRREGHHVRFSAVDDIRDAAAVVYAAGSTGFIELGGGGPKNFIQQTGPTLSQILGLDYDGADRGLQIGTANEREGSLSGCTFAEAVTWGKYSRADSDRLVQVWAEYSLVFPVLVCYLLESCRQRPLRRLTERMPALTQALEDAC